MSSSPRKSIYQPRCIDLAADGAFRGILIGVAWSASFRQSSGFNLWSLHQISVENGDKRPRKHRGHSTVARKPKQPSFLATVDSMIHFAENKTQSARSLSGRMWSSTPSSVRYVSSNTAAFSLFIGVFNGTMCASERIRNKTDWVNPFFAGFSAAAMFGLRNPSPVKMVTTCLACGAFTGGMYALASKD